LKSGDTRLLVATLRRICGRQQRRLYAKRSLQPVEGACGHRTGSGDRVNTNRQAFVNTAAKLLRSCIASSHTEDHRASGQPGSRRIMDCLSFPIQIAVAVGRGQPPHCMYPMFACYVLLAGGAVIPPPASGEGRAPLVCPLCCSEPWYQVVQGRRRSVLDRRGSADTKRRINHVTAGGAPVRQRLAAGAGLGPRV